MRKYSDADKVRWATIFQSDFDYCRPPYMTKAKTKKALLKVWDDNNFWFQCMERQGLLDKPYEEIAKFNLEHAAGNFWAMLREAGGER